MNLQEDNNEEINLSKIFNQKLEILQSQLPSILNDFKKYYVFYNKNPEFPEYQQMFQNIKGNLSKINSDMFILSNDVQTNINNLNIKFLNLDKLIQVEKNKNKKIKQKLGLIENKNNASFELISNYKEIYNLGYLRNWGLFLSILTTIIIIRKIFKPSTFPPSKV
jgi:hypothetical protein